MRINKKTALVLLCAVLLTASAFGVKKYVEHTRAVMVFGEKEPPFEEVLEQGLPDEGGGEGMGDIVKKLLGFDVREPYTVMESYSSVFGETGSDGEGASEETARSNEGFSGEESAAADMPETDEPVLPTFAQISASTGIAVSNAAGYSVDPDSECSRPLGISLEGEGPKILIVHTHTTECFDGDGMSADSDRSTDAEKNMAAVGEVMKAVFEKEGIGCIHDTTVHDYPSYQGAYTRELSTVTKNLEAYPSIKLVFDVHRDAFVYEDGSKLRLECDINGTPTAKVMIVCGTDAMGLYHPKWRENFRLASKIQNAAQIMYPGMMRPVNLRRERFNMHTTTGSLLFEIGSNGNSLPEAKEGAKNIAYAVSAVLLNRE